MGEFCYISRFCCIFSGVLLLSSCDVPTDAKQAAILNKDSQSQVEQELATPKRQPEKNPKHDAMPSFTKPSGTWEIVKVYAGQFNAGGWAQDDEQIVGSKFKWADDDTLLVWSDPENISFDQRDKCEQPILEDAANFKDAEMLAALRSWKIPTYGIKHAKAVKCAAGGRWGVPLSNGDRQYAVFVSISDNEMAMALFYDLVFLVRREQTAH